MVSEPTATRIRMLRVRAFRAFPAVGGLLLLGACAAFAPSQAQLRDPAYRAQVDCRTLGPQQAQALSVKEPDWRSRHPCWMVSSHP